MRMKTVIQLAAMSLLLMLCLSTSSCAADLTLWGLTADGADHLIGLRLGLEQDESKIEFGGSVKWQAAQPEWGPEPDQVGLYCIVHDLITIGNVDTPANWLEGMLARPYAGMEGMIPTNGEQRKPRINWLVGTLFSSDPEFRWSIAVEYGTGQLIVDEADQIWTIAGRLKF
jgi:hypothetical protein